MARQKGDDMRSMTLCSATIALFTMAGPAAAQVSPSTILGGPPPSAIVQKPINMKNVIAPTPAISAQQNRFNFSSLFAKFPLPTFPGKRGLSPQPIPSTFPSSSYNPFKLVGKPPVLLGDPRNSARPINVPTPIIPSAKSPVGPGSGG